MKKILKARKGGFTLVELLIVIMIIAILAGMMMLATGAATDTAEATRIINDLRATKAAGILLFMDEGQSWAWAKNGAVDPDTLTSLDYYMDRPLFDGSDKLYTPYIITGVTIKDSSGANTDRTGKVLLGFQISNSTFSSSVRDKLAKNSVRSGLYDKDGNIYKNATGTDGVYMILH